MPNIHEIIDSINDENVADNKEELVKAANDLHKSNKRLYARAKKAEGFEYNEEKKEWIKKEEPKKEEKPEKTSDKKLEQPNEPDYAKLAFLKGEGVTHPDDREAVMEEAKRLNLPLTDVLGMEHIKAKLKDNKAQREAEENTPSGRGTSRGKGNFKDSVDYWIDRKNKDGSYQTPADLELAEKVIQARIAKQEKAGMFSDELY